MRNINIATTINIVKIILLKSLNKHVLNMFFLFYIYYLYIFLHLRIECYLLKNLRKVLSSKKFLFAEIDTKET